MQPNGNAAPAHVAPAADGAAAAALIAGVAATAGAILAVYAPAAGHAIAARPVEFLGFLAAGTLLQLRTVKVPEQGSVSFASIGMMGAAFSLGIGAGMVVGAAAAAAFHAAAALDARPDDRFGPSVFAGLFFYLVNTGLLATAMGLDEWRSPWEVWKERLRWLAPYALASGAYAELAVVVYDEIGVVGIVALAIAPAALVTPIRRRMLWSS
jgi:hypothetical protein